MLIEELKDRYPLLYEEAKKWYKLHNNNRYHIQASIMGIHWARTDNADFWVHVDSLDDSDYHLNVAMSIRPDLFMIPPKELGGAIIFNNGLFV